MLMYDKKISTGTSTVHILCVEMNTGKHTGLVTVRCHIRSRDCWSILLDRDYQTYVRRTVRNVIKSSSPYGTVTHTYVLELDQYQLSDISIRSISDQSGTVRYRTVPYWIMVDDVSVLPYRTLRSKKIFTSTSRTVRTYANA